MCTPIGDSSAYDADGPCNGSSLFNTSQLKFSPRHQRHSCPPRPNTDEAGKSPEEGLCAQLASPGLRGTPRNVLGDWIYELRKQDPAPLLRPPHVWAPHSPRLSTEAAASARTTPMVSARLS